MTNFASVEIEDNMEPIVNKIAQSGLVTLDLENYLPPNDNVAAFDLKPFLFREMILKEKDFREALSKFDWEQFSGKVVAVFCSADAIIPAWAYMLVSVYLEPHALEVFSGSPSAWREKMLLANINDADIAPYENGKIILKGCGDHAVPESAFIAMTLRLRPIVKSLMFGEPCSTVPVYKKRK